MDKNEKKNDENWKEEVEKEKNAMREDKGFALPEADFSFFVTTLSIQASVFLGILPNPVSNQQEQNLDQAKFIIDTLVMIQEKTKNNLNAEEDKLLENMLYELRMQYAEKAKGEIK
jgi:hypothetical protein